MSRDLEAAATALVVLARFNISTDIQELLIYGNAHRDMPVPPGALSAAIKAVLETCRLLPSTGESNGDR